MKKGNQKKIKGILVAGMHRSGTSALTRSLNMLGCSLPKTLLPPSKNDNDLGFWEGKFFHDLNENILSLGGSRWDDWSVLNWNWIHTEVGVEIQENARKLIDLEYGDSSIIVLKDPRICRLLPFWVKIFQEKKIAPLIVLPIRNPLEVSSSLWRRNKIPPSYALLSWLRHVLDAEIGSRSFPRVFVRYKDILANWRKVSDHIALELGIQWPLEGATADAEIKAFLSPELRHHTMEDAEVFQDPDIADWIGDTFEILVRWTQKDIRREDEAKLDSIRHAFDVACPFFRSAVEFGNYQFQENKRLENILKQRDAEDRTLRARLEAMAEQQQTMVQKQAVLEAQLTERERTQKTLEIRLETETRQREAAALQWAVLETRLAERERTLHEHEVRLKNEISQREGATQKVAELESRLTERERMQLELITKLDAEVGHHQAAVRQSAIFEGRLAECDRISRSLETKLIEIVRQREVLVQKRALLEGQLAQSQKTQEILAERLETENKKRQQEIVVLSKLLFEKDRLANLLEDAFHKLLGSLKTCSPGSFRWRVALIKESRIFDEAWYLSRYPDVADDPAARNDPLGHFIAHGWREGRAANAMFARVAGEDGSDARKTDDSTQTAFERGPEDPS